MKVIHVTSEVGGGGAARSALNLHLGLLRRGITSLMAVGQIHGDTPPGVVKIPLLSEAGDSFVHETKCLVLGNRSPLSNTHFSLNVPGWNPATCGILRDADVINLHWVAGSISASSISSLAELGKPIVWTLHDMRPLTGGCHFPSGCSGFEAECRNCPQLLDNLDDLTAKNKTLLATAMQHTGIHLVAPSSWMFEQAKRATSRGENPLSIIPYGVDSFHFTPGDQLTSRERLGLAPRILYLLLAAQHHGEKRKGLGEALGILEKIKERDDLKQMISNGTLRVLLCGYHAEEVTVPGYQLDRVGHLDHESMPDLYRAADILLFTSLEDNLPNVVMEGLACGLPVVGHDLGGVRDLIGRESGAECLFQIGDADQAATLLHTLLLEKTQRVELGKSASLRMKTHFSLNKQTEVYLELYRSLLGNPLCAGKSKGVSREEEYRNLVGALSKKIETLEKHHLSLTHQLESHQILGGSKWLRLGQVLKLCHRL